MIEFDLDRFVAAQDRVYDQVCSELRRGRKTSHWMWFVFPQLRGLGSSATALRYGIEGRPEAVAYWAHPVLGMRLRECAKLVLSVPGSTAHAIFGSPDDLKLRSCVTLFHTVADNEDVFQQVLDRYFGGEGDTRTIKALAGSG